MLGEDDAIFLGHCFVERDLRQADAVCRSKECHGESECYLGGKHGSAHYEKAHNEDKGGARYAINGGGMYCRPAKIRTAISLDQY